MKRIAYVFLAEILLSGMLVTLAGAQSQPLGDYARAIRKEDKKEVGKKYDNDNLPTTDKISIVGNAAESTGPQDANPGSTSDANSAKPADSSTAGTTDSQAQDGAKKPEGADAQKATDSGNRNSRTRKPKSICSPANWTWPSANTACVPPRSMPTRATACAIRVHGTKKTRNTNNRSPRNKRPWMTPRRHWTT